MNNNGKIPWNKGKKTGSLSEEHKKKIAEKNKGNKYALGVKHTEDTKKKMSKAKKGKKYRLGKKSSEKTKIKQSIGIKAYFDLKGRKEYKKSDKKHLCSEYRYWMKEVKNRDNWKCKLSSDDCSGRLESHHIFNWKDYPELRYIINNGITLCAFHHPRGREQEKRMIPIFQELLSVSKE